MGRNQGRNLTIPKATSKSFELRFKKTTGAPEDISGWRILFTCKTKMEDTDAQAVITKDVTSHLDAENGKTLIELTPTDTDLSGSYYYDIKSVDTANNVNILFHGRITFRVTVTTRQ